MYIKALQHNLCFCLKKIDSFALAILYLKALFFILDRSGYSSFWTGLSLPPAPTAAVSVISMDMTVHFVSCQYFVLTAIKLFLKFEPHVSLFKSFICGFVCVGGCLDFVFVVGIIYSDALCLRVCICKSETKA